MEKAIKLLFCRICCCSIAEIKTLLRLNSGMAQCTMERKLGLRRYLSQNAKSGESSKALFYYQRWVKWHSD